MMLVQNGGDQLSVIEVGGWKALIRSEKTNSPEKCDIVLENTSLDA